MSGRACSAVVLGLLSGTAVMAGGAAVTVQAHRLSTAPILKPRPGWAATGIFNPTAIEKDGKTVLLFRATDGEMHSRIGYAESADGVHFNVRPTPVLQPETAYEQGGGVEDPRAVRIGATYYLTYTAYNGRDAQLALATSKDLVHWERKGVILPAYRGAWNTKWTKSGAILPQKVNGRWWMYYLGTRTDEDGKDRDYMGLASSSDLLQWSDATREPVLARRADAFDSRVMEPGPAPMMTAAGILLLYNGASERLVYSPGWALFDAHDPAKVVARAERPFLTPTLEWEKRGVVANVIFLEGAVAESPGVLRAYYGAADRDVGVARLSVRVAP